MTDEQQTLPIGEEPVAAANRTRRRRLTPGPLVCILVAICLLGIFALRASVEAMDGALVNILTAVFGFVAVATLLVWFGAFSGFDGGVRLGVVGGVMLLVVLTVGMLRIQQVDGGLVPVLRWRWQPDPDELLAMPEVSAGDADLSTTTAKDFPQFLGTQRDGIVRGVHLQHSWDDGRSPELLWRQEIGGGWSGFTAVNGFAVTLEQRGPDELVTCYEIETGRPIWVHCTAARHETMLGGVGPRSTPTIDEGRVYALGATGVLRCLDGADGRLLWSDDLLARIGVTPAEDLSAVAWGRANSPLIVDQFVIVPLGGPAGGPFVSLLALDKATGRMRWQAGRRQISYASPTLATIAGVPQVVIVCQDFVSAHDPQTGRVLWEHPWPGKSTSNANVSQAVPLPGDQILLSKGYSGGAMLLQVSRGEGGNWRTGQVWSNPRVLRTKFTNVVVRNGFAFGLSDGILECVSLQDGQRQWKHGRFGHGQILLVDGILLVGAEDGRVHLVDAAPEQFRSLGEMPAVDGKMWNNLCLFGKRLLVRNDQQAACFRLP